MPPDLPRGMHLQCLQHPYLWQLLLRTQPYDSKLSDNLDSNEHFFYFRNSPIPKDQFLLFGNDKLKVLTNSEEMLNRMDCNFPFMMLLLLEIKIHLARRVPIDPDNYVLSWPLGESYLGRSRWFQKHSESQRLFLLSQSTHLNVRGFSMLECFKTDWRGNIFTPKLNAYQAMRTWS